MFGDVGKSLIVFGAFFVVIGLVFLFWHQIPFLGRLPGDISFSKGNFQVFFPLVTSLVLSLILTIVVNVIFRLFR